MDYSQILQNQNISNQKKHVSIMVSKNQLLENGKDNDLMLSVLTIPSQMDTVDTISIPSIMENKIKVKSKKLTVRTRKMKKEKFSANVELAVDTKEKILIDKSNLCKINIQMPQSLKTLEVESISNVRDFSILSVKQLKEISQKLWLPTKIGSVDLDSKCSSLYLNNMELNSWFLTNQIIKLPNKNSLTIYSPSYTFLPIEQMGKENITSQNQKRKRKIVPIDVSKKACKFIVTTIYDNIVYGRECNNIVTNTNNDFCKDHVNKPLNKYDKIATNVCEHIITQESRGLNRKGMICGNFTFNTKNQKYCKQHDKQHSFFENNNDEYVLRSFKVRYYPKEEEVKKLNTYFGCCRKLYNLCIQNKENNTFITLRDKYITKLPKNEENKYMKNVPKGIREYAIKEYVSAMQTNNKRYDYLVNKKNKKNKKIKKPKMKYRKKKNDQVITIPKESITIENNQIYMYKESFSKNGLRLKNKSYRKDKRLKEFLKGKINHNIKLIKTRMNKYYICIPIDVKINRKKINDNNVVSCDPGGRTFMTTYSNYEIMEIGKDVNKQIYESHAKIDKLVNERKITDNKKEIKYRILKENTHLMNQINNLHHLTIKKLMRYERIFIPKLDVKSIMIRNQLPRKVKRQIQKLCHSLFLKRLKEKAETEGNIVDICSEYLTTKICGNCFDKNEVGSNKEYYCKGCGIKLDRDINGARNILIRRIKSYE